MNRCSETLAAKGNSVSWHRDRVLVAAAGFAAVGVPALSSGLIDGVARLWLYWLAVTVLNIGWLAVIYPIGDNPHILS